MFDKYYSPEQMEYLARRKVLVGEQRMREVQVEWQQLFDAFADLRAQGVSPASNESLILARKARQLIDEFTGGDAGIERSLRNLYQHEGSESVLSQKGMNAPANAMQQMARSMDALRDVS